MNFAKSSSIYFDNAAYIVIFQVGSAQLANVTTITAITKITIHFITVGINTKKSRISRFDIYQLPLTKMSIL